MIIKGARRIFLKAPNIELKKPETELKKAAIRSPPINFELVTGFTLHTNRRTPQTTYQNHSKT